MTTADRRPALVDELYAEAAEFLSGPRSRWGAGEPDDADAPEAGATPYRSVVGPGPSSAEQPRLEAAG